MEGLEKSYGVQYNKWYKNVLGDRLMIHHDSHKGSLFVTFVLRSAKQSLYPDGTPVELRITSVFERQDG